VRLVGVTGVRGGLRKRPVVIQELSEANHALICLGSDSAVFDDESPEMAR
jgi:hypothetical protein